MKHIEGDFQGARGAKLYYQAWLPEGEVKAVLFIVHGLGEHSGRYLNVVNHFVPLGYAVYAFDLPGHGRSEGDREYIERLEDYTGSVTAGFNLVRGAQAGRPIFLLGHSMGGLLAAHYLLDHQADFTGAIFSAPSVMVGESISPATLTLARLLSVVAPRMGVAALDASTVSRDPAVVKAYVDDPLVFHGKTPARTGGELLKAIARVSAEVGRLTLPFIAVQATEDKLSNPNGARMLYERAGSTDKTLKIYTGLYHEVFNEPERAQVLKDVEDWLATHA